MQIAAVLLSTFLMWLSFPPVDWGILIFVAPAPLLWAMRRVTTLREAGWLGFLFGFTFWGSMLWWIKILGFVALIPLAIVMALFTTAWAMAMHQARNWSMWRWWLFTIGAWAFMEFLRARIPFGGFPWGAVGFPVGDLAWPRGAAQWIGPTGWAVIVIGVAAAVVVMVQDEDRRPLELSLAVVLTFTFLGAIFAPDAAGQPVRVALVQGNSPCPRVHCENEKEIIYTRHLAETQDLEPGTVDLVVWGEDSFGGSFNPTFNGEVRRQMGTEASRLGTYLIAGGTRPGAPGTFDNYNVLFAPNRDDPSIPGEIVGEYLKQHPVPFGEFVPFRRVLEFVPQLDQVPNDMRRGAGPVVFPLQIGSVSGRLGSVISFEGAFPRHIRGEVKAGAQIVVVATNEGSYGVSPASDQLIGMVQMSAVSLGVDIIHVAVTGKSTIIRADGTVGKSTELFTRDVLTGTVNLQDSPRTLYAVVGDWVQILAILTAMGLTAATAVRPTRDFRIRPGVRR